MSYQQLTREQRYQIYALKKADHSQAEMAAIIGCHKYTAQTPAETATIRNIAVNGISNAFTDASIKYVYPALKDGNQQKILSTIKRALTLAK